MLQRGKVGVGSRKVTVDVPRMFKTREEQATGPAERDGFLAITSGDVARPVLKELHPVFLPGAKEDDGVSVFACPDPVVPEDLEEVSGSGSREVVEIRAQPEFVKEPRGSRAVGIPSPPDAGAVGLSRGSQGYESL